MAESRCPRKESLAAYLDRRLSAPDTEDLEDHLAACAACRAEVADLALLMGEVAASTLTPSDRWMQAALARAFAPRRRPVWPWVAAAAGLLVALGLIFALRGDEPPPTPVVRQRETPKRAPPLEQIAEPPAPPPVPPPAPPREPQAPKPIETPRPTPVPPPPAPPVKPEEKPVPKEEPKPEAPKPKETIPEPKPVYVPAALFAAAGTASTRPDGEAAWKTLKVGQTVELKGLHCLRTNGARAKTRLGADTLYLSRATDLTISPEKDVTRLRLAQGEAFFSVNAQERKGVAFAVGTPHGTVTVRGTRFLVTVQPKETQVHVERGTVDFAAAGKTLTLTDGESAAAADGKEPRAAGRAAIAPKTKWVQDLEENLKIEAELLALKPPLRAVRDPAASGGGAIGVTGNPSDNAEGAAEARVRLKQPVPYAVWMRVLFTRARDTGWTLHLGDRDVALDVPSAAQWQWLRLGPFDLPEGEFRLRLTQRMSDARVDQIILSSDPDYDPK